MTKKEESELRSSLYNMLKNPEIFSVVLHPLHITEIINNCIEFFNKRESLPTEAKLPEKGILLMSGKEIGRLAIKRYPPLLEYGGDSNLDKREDYKSMLMIIVNEAKANARILGVDLT